MVESKLAATTVEGAIIWLTKATITQLTKIEKLIRISRTESELQSKKLFLQGIPSSQVF